MCNAVFDYLLFVLLISMTVNLLEHFGRSSSNAD